MKNVFISLFIMISLTVNATVVEKEYDGFKLWVDCDLRGSVMYHYTLQSDIHSVERTFDYKFAPNVTKECQQTSTAPYPPIEANHYDHGLGVPFRHIEHSQKAAQQTNYMVNVWPMHRDLNQGAMLQTELIAECYREIEDIEVYGGIIAGATPANSEYLESHGIHTPGYFWRAFISSERAIAWIFPNKPKMNLKTIDDYIVTLNSLEVITMFKFPVDKKLKNIKPNRSWVIPQGCGLN